MIYTHDDAINDGKQTAQPNFEYMKKNSLLDYEVYMMGKPQIQTAQLRTDQVYIRGRHSTLTRTDGTYNDITIEFGIRFRSRGMAQDAQKKRDIVQWLRYGYGYSLVDVDVPNTVVSLPIYQPEGHLKFHHMPNTTFKVKTIAPFAWEWHPATQQWHTKLSFLCDPFGYGALKTATLGGSTYRYSKTVRPNEIEFCPSIGVLGYAPGSVGNQTSAIGYESAQFRDNTSYQEYNVLSSTSTSSYTSIGTVKEPAITDNARNLIRSCWTNPVASGAWGGYLGWGEYYNGESSWRNLVTYDNGGRPKYSRRSQNRFTMYNDHDSEDYLVYYKLWAPVDATIVNEDPTYPNTDLRGKPLYCKFTIESGNAQVAVRYRKAGTTTMTSLGWKTTEHQVTIPSDAEAVELCIKVPKASSARIQELGLYRAKPSQHSINVSTTAVYETSWDIFAIAKSIDPTIFNGLTTTKQKKDRLSARNLKVELSYNLGFWSQAADKDKAFNSIRIGTRVFDNRALYDKHMNLSDVGRVDDYFQRIGTAVTYNVPLPATYIRDDAEGMGDRSGYMLNLVILDSVSTNACWLQPSYTQCTVSIDAPSTVNAVTFRGIAENAPIYPTILLEADPTATKIQIDTTYSNGAVSTFWVDLQAAGAMSKILIDTETMIVKATSVAESTKWGFYNGYTQGSFPYISQDWTYYNFKGIKGATFYYRDKFLVS
ncbi:hypothetical protein COE80_19480 [Bacillus pseudomycoides]|uniref:hypothetical protein n=1 Tax=Bacillus pseudomycoides TaxID=64104 RepID=UPI000BFBA42B|nr:hypothetical protein [Bacillus pseudomycoides]PHB23096.1 hypothetical protein COE80_19480 [Bacillus pseudomycoides]PHE37625.1 hypothetical protein COF51_16445 [Bacillus pseudomycoides]